MMEPVPTQKVMKVEPISSNHCVELLSESVPVPFLENNGNQTSSTSTGISTNTEPGMENLVHEAIQCGKTFSSPFGFKRYEKTLHRVTEEFQSARTESAATQEILKVEPANSNECVDQLNESVHASVHEDCRNQTNSTGACISNSERDTARPVHECIHCGKTYSSKSGLKRHEKSFHRVTEEFLSARTELLPTQDMSKAESSNSNQGNDLLSGSVLADKDQHNQTSSTRTSTCNAERDTARPVHECVLCGKTYSSKFGLKRHERSYHGVTEEFQSDKMEPLPIPDISKAQPTGSNQCMKQLNESVQSPVHEDYQANSTGTGVSNSEQDTTRPVYECVHCGKTYSSKPGLKRHERSLHRVTEEFKPARTEPVLTQEVLKVEPTSSNKRVDLLDESLQAPVHEDCRSQANSMGTSISNSERDTSRPVLECVDQLNESIQAPVHEDCRSQANSSGTSISNSERDTARPVLECVHCKKTFKRKYDLRRHERIFHPTEKPSDNADEAKVSVNKRRSKCEVCDRLFDRESNLRKHVFRVHCKIRSFECDVCLRKFYEKGELTTHRRIHTGEKPYECEICAKRFVKKAALDIHRRVHDGEKPYQCEICMTRFKEKSTLNRHVRVHTGDKPYQCEICMKKFSQRSVLNQHSRVHTGEKPFQCEICMKKFGQKSVLHKHKRFHMGEKPYQCEICTKTFREKSVLNSHRRTHTGERPYECEICMKKFSERSDLNKHGRVHTGEKPYECDICLKRYCGKTVLDKHRRIHTVEKNLSENV